MSDHTASVWSLTGLAAFGLHKLHSLLLDRLDALWGAVFLLILQVALEEELDLLHRHAEVDDAVEQGPAGKARDYSVHRSRRQQTERDIT